jgi:shikimate dehydrogenase
MRRFGLIGYPLTHSFSKNYFEDKFQKEQISDCDYQLYPLKVVSEILPLVKSVECLSGLNVTIPYKESVVQYLDSVSEQAKQIGAVNCIKVQGNQLTGYNTDVYGFRQSLTAFLKHKPDMAFILGKGGGAKAVKYVLEQLGLNYILVSREPEIDNIGYMDIAPNMKASNLFINTTPLGMYPKADFYPEIPYNQIGANDYLFDLVYNPAETLFLKKGKQKGALIKNGLEMLYLQADKSWEIWNG